MADLKVWRSDKVEVRDSPLSGQGLFARDAIAAGEVVAVKAGHVVDTTEVERLTAEIDDFSLQIHDDLFLSPHTAEEVDDLVVHINHSCDANIGFEGIAYVAMRDIEPNEELCHDYALARSARYSMECRCGAEGCRGTVTGEDWKLPSVQAKYGHFFMPHLLKRVLAAQLGTSDERELDEHESDEHESDGEQVVEVIHHDVLVEIEHVLSAEDHEAIQSFADHIKVEMPENFESREFGDEHADGGGNGATYMNQVFQEALPDVFSRIVRAADRGIAVAGWSPTIEGDLGVRCIERLEYEGGGHLGWHEDSDSIYTLILSLSQVGMDFDGGELEIRSPSGEIVAHLGPMGSLLVFPSELSHAVTPIHKGRRTVLVLEFWRFRDAGKHDLRPGVQYGVAFE